MSKPAFEIIDSHIHYWQPSLPDRPWDVGADSPTPEVVPVEELMAAAKEAGVDRVVDVVPSLMGYDNRYGFECAQAYPDRIAGVFARFDPVPANLAQRLEVLRTTPRFLGVRLTLLTPLQRSWFNDDTLTPLFDAAAEHHFPIAVYAKGLPAEIAALARRHPRTTFLIDHMALDWRDKQPFFRWSQVLAMVKLSNVCIKVSYFPEASHEEPYPYARARRYVRELVDTFGVDRLIWGTNYPPSRHACSYRQSLEFALDSCSFMSESDQAKFFSGTFKSVLPIVI